MTWYVLVHNGGGSTVEAAQPDVVEGPFVTMNAAVGFEQQFRAAIERWVNAATDVQEKRWRQDVKWETWTQSIEVPLAQTSVDEVLAAYVKRWEE